MYLLNLYREGHLIDQHVLSLDECVRIMDNLPSGVTYKLERIQKGLMVNEENVLIARGI